MEEIYERIADKQESMMQCDLEEPSEIQQFFAGKNVLLTGSTGYLGKCTVEKLLRGCPEMKKLYLLVRPKKDMSMEKRMRHLFEHILFEPLRKSRPTFIEQVVVIKGDLTLPDMGMSAKDRQFLIETTDVIIHNAANVSFTVPVRTILEINVLGTKKMLDLACECHHLKAFMYVSTAYSQLVYQRIEEKFYPPPADMKAVHDMIKADTENERGLSDSALATLVGKWLNIYIFSKAVAESVIQDYSRKVTFPCGVFRMSVVTSTFREPLRAWCGNMNGPVLPLVFCGLGILHTWWLKKDAVLDVVPADMTVNAMIAATWDLAEHKKDLKEGIVYNYGSSVVNPIRQMQMYTMIYNYGVDSPSMKMLWHYFVLVWQYKFFFYITHVLFHFLPALLIDTYRVLRLKKAKLVSMFLKIEKNRDWIEYFSSGDWRIDVAQMTTVWDRMNPTDHEIFYSDLRTFNWNDYFYFYWRGLRVYLLNDPMYTVKAANRRYMLLKIAHFSLTTFLLLLLLYYFVIPMLRYVYEF